MAPCAAQDVTGDTKLDADGNTDVTGVWTVAGNKLTITGSTAAGMRTYIQLL
jgi:hypothetical protein